MQSFPLPLQILEGPDEHNVLQLVVVKVAGSQGHDEVSKSDQSGFHVSKYAHDHVTTQNRHGGLTPGLRGEESKKKPDFYYMNLA